MCVYKTLNRTKASAGELLENLWCFPQIPHRADVLYLELTCW